VIEPQGHGSEVVPVRLVRDRAGAAAGSPAEMGPEPQPGLFLFCARGTFGSPRVTPSPASLSARGRAAEPLLRYGESSVSPARAEASWAMRRSSLATEGLPGGSGVAWRSRCCATALGFAFARGGECVHEAFLSVATEVWHPLLVY
jgi:hypothetical protein